MFKAFELPQGATPLFFKEVKYPQGTLHGFELADKRRFYAKLDGPGTNMYGYVSLLDNVTVFRNPMPPATGRQKAYLLFRYEENGVCGYRQYEDSYDFPVKTTNTVLYDLTLPAATPTVDKRFDACEQVRVVKIDGNSFRIKTTNGRVTVEGTWQTFGKCSTCPEAAEKALQAALQKARDRNGGSITESTPIVEKKDQSYGDAGVISYSEMKLMDILKNLSKTYNSLVDKAKVPEAVWKPQEDLPAEDKNFFVQDKTRVISGALDQAIEEARDLPELVGLGLKLASDPQGAYDELSSFAQQMSWQKAKDFAKEAAKSTVQYDYLTNPKNEYKLYGTGRLGVSIVKLAAGGAALKFAAMVKKSPDFLALWNRLRDKMDNLSWTQADKDRFRADFETIEEDFLKRFDEGEFDLGASKVLDANKILRRKIANQASLTKIKNKLPNGITMDDVKGLIANSDSKQVLLDQLSTAIDDIDLNTFKSMFDGKVFYNKVATLNLLETLTNPPLLSTTQALIDNQKQLRTAIDELKSTGQQYSTEYNALMKQVNDHREVITEQVSDAYFASKKATEVKFTWPNSPKQGNFDRVYKNADGTWSVVECKGGNSGLKGRKDANGDFNQQGTIEYFNSIIDNLQANELKLTSTQKEYLTQLRQAFEDGKIQSYVLRQKFNDDGSLGNTLLSTVSN